MIGVLGAALLPLLQGWFADKMGIQVSFIVPMGAFVYVAFYGLFGYRAGRRTDKKLVTTSTVAATMEGKAT